MESNKEQVAAILTKIFFSKVNYDAPVPGDQRDNFYIKHIHRIYKTFLQKLEDEEGKQPK